MFQRSRSGGPDTVPSTACEQQSETPVNMTHTPRGRFWTQWRNTKLCLSEVYNGAFRISATSNPITFFRSINSTFCVNFNQPCRSQPQNPRRREYPVLQGGSVRQRHIQRSDPDIAVVFSHRSKHSSSSLSILNCTPPIHEIDSRCTHSMSQCNGRRRPPP